MAGKTVTPTKGESLFIWRRRKGLNQVDAAAEFNTSSDTYREWEAGRRTHDLPRQHLGQLKPHEVCVLMRRREKLTQLQLATAMGVTRLWINRMETGQVPLDRLRDHWGV